MSEPMPIRVAVLFGGTGAEAAVSCTSAADVLACTAAFDTPPIAVYLAPDGAWYRTTATAAQLRCGSIPADTLTPTFPVRLGNQRGLWSAQGVLSIDVALPVLHGDGGEDGTVQGALTTAAIPYVGADTRTGALGCDKVLCKLAAQAAGIPVTPFAVYHRGDSIPHVHEHIRVRLGPDPFPLFVKPTSLGSSVGVAIVTDKVQLDTALTDTARYGDVLIEPYLHPLRELEIGWLDGALPVFSDIADIRAHGRFYDYNEKYRSHTAAVRLPAALPCALCDELYAYAQALPSALGLRDLCRMDFFLTKDGRLYFNEVNTFPGFAEQSMYPRMMARMGIPYAALVRRLCAMAYARGV